MNELLKKLNYKGRTRMLVLQAPEEFGPFLDAFREAGEVCASLDEAGEEPYGLVLVFCKSGAEVEALAPEAARRCAPDQLLWFAYPKKTSKKYKADITRDTGWQPLGRLGFEGVRQIAIDEDWSALRFREARYVKTMTRSGKLALSEEGRQRVQE
ncbi:MULTISPECIES: DUF3052 domain-containing protein [Paenibacillus]|uniref:DUF3052 domain-containing protein n=1 Tax=Paenibacillus TaxID=44249 RepID=UPI0022B8C278|nr:DUF3052 domain-containing protein [Paenibacillus caseinilyticus]MCZ8522474.1 DUF3052 domain-containing protein [Paenibacillus caseinilyticus]